MSTESLSGMRLLVTGRVQGLGVRPAVARLARQLGLCGRVANSPSGLMIDIEGSSSAIERFQREWLAAMPDGVRVDHIQSAALEVAQHRSFEIVLSLDVGVISATVPVDLVACSTCLQEVLEGQNTADVSALRGADRRQGYAFASCTHCGPRYSIIRTLPYDRATTSMSAFAVCSDCAGEYGNEHDRRYHAQTNACRVCGPTLIATSECGMQLDTDRPAVESAAAALLAGQIVALKGLGGYQLLVDATSQPAVARLRERKGRRTKPFAIMVRDLDEADRVAHLSDDERKLLASAAGPIVIAQANASSAVQPEVFGCLNVAPHDSSLSSTQFREGVRRDSFTATIGLMLPTTPLHALLLALVGRPLVVTSGNHEGSVLAYRSEEAERSLKSVAEFFLHHDREIVRPIDDSVMRVIDRKPCVLRLARGLAPLSLPPLAVTQPIIALGGQMKNAIAIWNGSQAVLGPHVGDLENVSVCERWEEQLRALVALYGVDLRAAAIVHDAHPDYFTTHWARAANHRLTQPADSTQRTDSTTSVGELHAVFHHHAHVAAVMLEQQLQTQVLGFAWDGTGYGEDGSIWGSEALLATRTEFRRVAALRSFPLLGGEVAIREPWRVAVALVAESLGVEAARQLHWPSVRSDEIEAIIRLLARPQLSPRTRSMGRLFDAVAALTLGVTHCDDEGHAALILERTADRETSGCYSLPHTTSARQAFVTLKSNNELPDIETQQADWRPLIAALMADLKRGATAGEVAMKFHRSLANWAQAVAGEYEKLPLIISGGCFQNGVLRELFNERFRERAAGYFEPINVPPGDGGLAAGQLAIAAARIRERDRDAR